MARISSMADLPKDVQDRESATFDFKKVKAILKDGYFRGPAINDDDQGKTGMRKQSLRRDPRTHRDSILRKATDTDLLKRTPEGYATTPRGVEILDEITICDNCGADEEVYEGLKRTSKRRGYMVIFTGCPKCNDYSSMKNTSKYNRSDEGLKKAASVMESHDVECYLNDRSLSDVQQQFNL